MTRESFVFYKSFHTALKDLPPEEYKRTMIAVCEYALLGKEPELEGIPYIAFELIRPQLDANNKRYADGKKGGRPKKTTGFETEKPLVTETENQWLSDEKPNVNDNDNVNDNVNVCSRAIPTRFLPPTTEEVREYAKEKGYAIDAERFVDFYESKGWMVGKNKMKDWKAAARNWSRDKPKQEPKKGYKGSNYEQRSFDYDALLASRKLS